MQRLPMKRFFLATRNLNVRLEPAFLVPTVDKTEVVYEYQYNVNVEMSPTDGEFMLEQTKANIGRSLAVVIVNPESDQKEIKALAIVRGPFGGKFMISGLKSKAEAEEVAYALLPSIEAPITVVKVEYSND